MIGNLRRLKQNMMEKVEIIDDFLDDYLLQELKLGLLPNTENKPSLPWSFGEKAGGNTSALKNYQFTYLFYTGYPTLFCDDSYYLVDPIVQKIPDLYQLVRIKANLQPHSEEKYVSAWHWDSTFGGVRDENNKLIKQGKPIKNAYVCIFYLNTNNGYTELDDGTKVDCVENRLLIFPNEMKHRGVSTNDTMFKSVVNIVFVKYTT